MARTYTPKRYELKAIGLSLPIVPAKDRANYKALQLVNTPFSNFSLRNIDVALASAPTYRDGLLEVFVTAKRAGQTLKVDNPLLFQNPPIMVWDGTYHQEFNAEFNITQDVKNYVEDPVGALQEIITQVIEGQNL